MVYGDLRLIACLGLMLAYPDDISVGIGEYLPQGSALTYGGIRPLECWSYRGLFVPSTRPLTLEPLVANGSLALDRPRVADCLIAPNTALHGFAIGFGSFEENHEHGY